MKKIPSLFKRSYEGDRLVYDEVVEGSEWVVAGEGVATVKIDGTSCMVKDGKLYKRYDRKRNKKTGEYREALLGWIPCEEEPDENTGHWPGWLLIGDGPEDKWHREALENESSALLDGTYELTGPKIQGNPHKEIKHYLTRHDSMPKTDVPVNFDDIKDYLLSKSYMEGIVWHHPDGRMVKIKKKDFGLKWP